MGRLRNIVVLGLGYVGLPIAVMLAKSGYEVAGVDIRDEILAAVRSGVLQIKEKEIVEIFQEPSVRSNLTAHNKPVPADAFIIAVGTPLDEKRQAADLSQVQSALDSIIPVLRPGNLIIVESTVPPLTCRNLVAPKLRKAGLEPGKDVYVAHCPERILPGNIHYEIVNTSRIIGGMDAMSAQLAAAIYASFVKGPIYLTDDVTAELVKLMENTYRDVNIALANEFAGVAEGLGVDIVRAINLANQHPRVHILRPGIGAGGHCIPVDPWFIRQVNPKNAAIIYTARMVNEAIPEKIASKVRQLLRGTPHPKIVALGLSYKANTDDVRNSPAAKIVELLRSEGYDIVAYDPLVKGKGYGTIVEAASGADCLLVLVEHDTIMDDLRAHQDQIKSAMRNPLIVRFFPDPGPTPVYGSTHARAGEKPTKNLSE